MLFLLMNETDFWGDQKPTDLRRIQHQTCRGAAGDHARVYPSVLSHQGQCEVTGEVEDLTPLPLGAG